MAQKRVTFLLIFATTFAVHVFAAPANSDLSFVVSSTEPSSKELGKEGTEHAPPPTVPKIYQMHVRSNISNRFAHTTIISKVKNVAEQAQEATFAVVLPETAFISGFIMEVDGKNYTAYVKEKEEAKKDYDQAVASGLGAAHVAVSARDSNRFTVSVNVEPETKAAFYLSYEELLSRQDGHYEQVINLHPGEPVKDLSVEVVISESRKITDLKTPPLRSGNEVGSDKSELDPRANIEYVNDTAAIIKFTPNVEKQKQLTYLLGNDESNGLSGQFVVQYDVERDPHGGEVLIQDGYFVHFFAPSDLTPLPKHIVFVLDTSSSMYNQKIEQLKEAMHKILEQLHDNDLFNLVEFNSNTKVWNLDVDEASVWYPSREYNYGYGNDETEEPFKNYTFPNAYPANADNIKKAKATVSAMMPTGGTDIHTALKVGLHLVELAKEHKIDDVNRQPIVVFLTDGDPTVRLTDREEITNKITEYNIGARTSPIFALSFGAGADKKFLQKLAVRNSGFSKHIYEAADASLQLQDFYKQISSPLLANVTFKYEPSVTSLTTTDFPIHFGGSELVIAGWCGTVFDPPVVHGWGREGPVALKSTVKTSVTSMERLWAYLTVKQLLEKKETASKDMEQLKKKALDLAIKYQFVTSVSSLVVVKPNATNAVDTEDAADGNNRLVGGVSLRGGGYRKRVMTSHHADTYGAPLSSPGNRFWSMPGSLGGGSSYSPNAFGRPGPPPPAFAPSFLPPAPSLAEASFDSFHPITPASRPSLSTTIPQATTDTADLFAILPWLKNILNVNGAVTLPSGTYKLGLNETISDVLTCPKTPLNAEGHCTLLHSCPEVHSILKSSDDFIQYSCVLRNEFAGVCCPQKIN